jgi:hypothetical protein
MIIMQQYDKLFSMTELLDRAAEFFAADKAIGHWPPTEAELELIGFVIGEDADFIRGRLEIHESDNDHIKDRRLDKRKALEEMESNGFLSEYGKKELKRLRSDD